MTSIPPYRIKRAAAARRGARGRAGAGDQRPGVRLRGRQRPAGRRLGDQDVPQRDDQGPGGDGDRELHHRTPLWRGGRGDRVAARDVPRHRLGEAGGVLLPAGHRARPPAQRGSAGGRRDGTRRRSRALVGERHRRAPGLRRRSRRRRRLRSEGHRRPSRAAPTGASKRTASCAPLGAARPSERPSRTIHGIPETPGWLDWHAEPLEAALPGAGRRGRCALPCLRPRRRVPVRRRAQVHAVRRLEGAAVRAARPPRLRPQRRRPGHLPWRRQPRDGRRAARTAMARRAASPRCAAASPTPNCRRCTTPACAACASTSSSASSTSRPRTSCSRSPGASRPGAGTWSSISRPSTCRSCGTSSPRCRRRSSSITWAGPTCPSRSTGPSSRSS